MTFFRYEETQNFYSWWWFFFFVSYATHWIQKIWKKNESRNCESFVLRDKWSNEFRLKCTDSSPEMWEKIKENLMIVPLHVSRLLSLERNHWISHNSLTFTRYQINNNLFCNILAYSISLIVVIISPLLEDILRFFSHPLFFPNF